MLVSFSTYYYFVLLNLRAWYWWPWEIILVVWRESLVLVRIYCVRSYLCSETYSYSLDALYFESACLIRYLMATIIFGIRIFILIYDFLTILAAPYWLSNAWLWPARSSIDLYIWILMLFLVIRIDLIAPLEIIFILFENSSFFRSDRLFKFLLPAFRFIFGTFILFIFI